jgi:hypothetical protein
MPDLIPQNASVGSMIPGPVGDKLTAAATKYKVDPLLVQSLAQQESGGSQHARSPKGAIGVMQLMPHTAQQLGVDPTDEDQNIDGGVRYLSQMLDRYSGDKDKALAAYNAGPGAVDAHNGVPPYKETQNYVKNINSRLPDTTAPSAPAASSASTPSVTPTATQSPAAPPAAAEAIPQGAQIGDPIEAGAKIGAENAPKEQPSINPTNPNFHPWDWANTPTADLITGQSHFLKNKLNSVFSSKTPEQFAQDHPWLSGGENIAEGLTSPLGVVLAAGGPLTEGAEALPTIGKYLAPAIRGVTKAANLGVAAEGGINAAKGISDISTEGANPRNVTQTGLSLAQALLGLHGGLEMSNTALPEDVMQGLKEKGINPTLGVASQNPGVQTTEDVLAKSMFGKGPLARNRAANETALDDALGDTSLEARQQARLEVTETGQAARAASTKASQAADAAGEAGLSATEIAEKQMRAEMMQRMWDSGRGLQPSPVANPLEDLVDRQGQPYTGPSYNMPGESQPYHVPRPGMGTPLSNNPEALAALEQARMGETAAKGAHNAAQDRANQIAQAAIAKRGMTQYLGPKVGTGTNMFSLGNALVEGPGLVHTLAGGPHGLMAAATTGVGENVLSRLLTNPQFVWALTHTSQSKALLTALTQDIQQAQQ